jgi:hypothetical protein
MKSLFDCLKSVKDHRRAQGQRTPFYAFLEMIVLAGMSGHFGFRPISRFIYNNQVFFIERYNLQHGVPAYATLRNFTKEIEYNELCVALHEWCSQYIEEDDWIAIDGKVMASTVTNSHDSKQNYKSMVSSFCNKKGIVINTESFENKKENEGETARELIRLFENKGVTFTLDALHCQKKLPKLSWSQEMTMYSR